MSISFMLPDINLLPGRKQTIAILKNFKTPAGGQESLVVDFVKRHQKVKDDGSLADLVACNFSVTSKMPASVECAALMPDWLKYNVHCV